MIQLALIVALATLGVGLAVALLLRLLPTVRSRASRSSPSCCR